MGWALFDCWDDLRYYNYGESMELEDGTVAAWLTEDWEIYGGGGGQAAPYDSWEDDIRRWLQNGSQMAYDIIAWDQAYLTSRNISQSTQETIRDAAGTSFTEAFYDPTPTFSGPYAEYEAGDIVVTGTAYNWDGSTAYRLAMVDPFTHQYLTWVETAGFLYEAAANADSKEVKADFSLVGGATPELIAAYQSLKTEVASILQSLNLLDTNGYFYFTYVGADGSSETGKIKVSQLISSLSRVDFELHPNGTFASINGGVGATKTSWGDVQLQIEVGAFQTFSQDQASRTWYLLHEIVHATSFGKEMRSDLGLGGNLERMVNSFARDIARTLNVDITSFNPGFGYTTTNTVFVDPTT